MAVPAPPTNVTATVDSNSQITISWDYDPTWFAFDGNDDSLGGFDEGRWFSSDSVDNFEIELTRDANGWIDPAGGPVTVTHDGSTSYSATYNPASDAAYDKQVGIDSMFKFRVRAMNTDGGSDWAISGKAYTEPVPPHNPSVSRPDSETIRINGTVKSDIGDFVGVYFREDTGSGYGGWNVLEWVTEGESMLISGSVDTTGSDFTLEFKTGVTYQEDTLHNDARYQFRLNTYTYADPSNISGGDVYADYGNRNNVYFQDDFEAGDASAWDATDFPSANNGSSGVVSTLDSRFVETSPEEGSYAVELMDGGYVQKNLGDLSAETDVHVRTYVQAASWDSGANSLEIKWYDGSAWQTLSPTYEWEMNQQGWIEIHASVPDSYLSTDSRVRLTQPFQGSYAFTAYDRVVVSDILHEYTKPAAPTSPTTDESVEDELTLDWTDNTSLSNGSPEWFHRVYGSGNSFTKEFDNPPHTWTGLNDGERYEWYPYAVYPQARNGNVDTWWRADGPTTTGTTILPAPSIDSISTASDTSLDVAWTDHADNEDGFEVYYRESGTSTWNKFSDLGSNTTTETITSLSQDTAYEVRIDDYTEHVTTQSGTSTGTTNLNESRSISSYSSSLTSSAIRVITISESISSYAPTSGSSSIRVVALVEGTSSHSTSISASSGRLVGLFEGVTSSSTTLDSSSVRVVTLFEGVSSYAATSTTGATRLVTLLGDISSHSSTLSSSSKRVVSLLEGVTSSASTSSSSVSTVVDLSFAVDSHSKSFISNIEVLINLLVTPLSESSPIDSSTTRSGINFEGRESDISYSASSGSSTLRVVDLLESVSSYSSISSTASSRGNLNYADRQPDSFSDILSSEAIGVIDVSYGIESHSKSGRSFVYNDRTSLELIDHDMTWDDANSVWYTDWFFETKITGNEDEMAVRSLVVKDAKEPAAVVTIQYDGTGDGTVDEESDPVYLGREQSIRDVNGVPIDEDGRYRIKIMEYSGYNSLYALDTAIVH
jgi:hypothetical protein